jgi:transcriptional regulator with XRE-family HTH domain
MRSHQEVEARLFKKNKGLKQALEKRDIAFEIALMLIEARAFKNLTQEALAKLMKTKQPSIARVENGVYLPSIAFLLKAVKALGAELEIKFRFSEVEEAKKEIVTINAQKSHAVWSRLDIHNHHPVYTFSPSVPNSFRSESRDVKEVLEFSGAQHQFA